MNPFLLIRTTVHCRSLRYVAGDWQKSLWELCFLSGAQCNKGLNTDDYTKVHLKRNSSNVSILGVLQNLYGLCGTIKKKSIHKLWQWSFEVLMNSFLCSFLEEKVFTTVKTENRVKIKSFEKTGKIKKNQLWIFFGTKRKRS